MSAAPTRRELDALKLALVRQMGAALIKEPKFNGPDSVASTRDQVSAIAQHDGEFILKLALFVRSELGLRGSANLLVALAAHEPTCQSFLRAYLPTIAALPTDMLDVATFAGKLGDGRMHAQLRKAVAETFETFNEFELAKYNRENSAKKKAQRAKAAAAAVAPDSDTSGSDEEATDAERAAALKAYTLKGLIRILHMHAPAYNVACICGSPYPQTEYEFLTKKYDVVTPAPSRGEPATRAFEPGRAGTRMRLHVPETWETQLAARGNTAAVWNSLIAGNKVPFMAMLRNLRNIILAGCSPGTHDTIIAKLESAQEIAKSKQFPYRFFSAFEALKLDLSEEYETPAEAKQREAAEKAARKARGKSAPRGEAKPEAPPKKKRLWPERPPTPELFARYDAALNTAIVHATNNNIRPIYGRTFVFVACNQALLDTVKASGGGAIGSVRTYMELALLLGVMFRYACEDVAVVLFCGDAYEIVTITRDGRLLNNVSGLRDPAERMAQGTDDGFPFRVLQAVADQGEPLNTVVVIDRRERDYSGGANQRAGFSDEMSVRKMCAQLRDRTNPDLLYVNVALGGSPSTPAASENPLDVMLTGFSDAILRFVAERGENPLQYIERIDVVKNIPTAVARERAITHLRQGIAERIRSGDISDSDDESTSGSRDSSRDSSSNSDGETDATSSVDENVAVDDAAAIAAAVDAEDYTVDAPTSGATVAPIGTAIPRCMAGYLNCRFFISSTFLDMASERQCLVQQVFPLVRRMCAERGLRVNVLEVDLRWGITDEHTAQQQGLSICLSETAVCAPFFIGLVGERRGYCPKQSDATPMRRGVSAKAFEWLKRNGSSGASITRLEYMQALESAAPWRDGRGPRPIMLARRALQLDNAARSTYAAEGPEAVSAMRDFRAAIKDAADEGAVVAYGYDAPLVAATDRGGCPGLEMSHFRTIAVRAVMAQIEAAVGVEGLDESSASFSSSSWGEDVSAPAGDRVDPDAAETAAQDRSAAAYTEMFAGREAQLHAVRDFIAATLLRATEASATSNVLCVTGMEGAGKTAFVAAASGLSLPRAVISLTHNFATGAGTVDAFVLRLARLLIRELEAEEDVATPESLQAALTVLPELYRIAWRRGRHVVLFLAAADACAQPLLLTQSLGVIVPASERVVCLVTEGRAESPLVLALRARVPPVATCVLEELPRAARIEVLARHLGRLGKELMEHSARGRHMSPLLRKSDAGRPGYLVTALAWLRMFATHDTLLADIRRLPSTMTAVLSDIVQRLERSHGGETLCRRVLLAIYASEGCGGIAELDLYRIGGGAAAVRQLLATLEDGLEWRQGRVVFGLRALRDAVQHRYTRRSQDVVALRGELVDVMTASLPRDGALPRLGSLSGASVVVLLHHALAAGRNDVVERAFTTVACLNAAVAAGLFPDLVALAQATAAKSRVLAKKLDPFVQCMLRNQHAITQSGATSNMTLQCAANDKSPVVRASAAAAIAAVEAETGESPRIVRWSNVDRHGESECTATVRVSQSGLTCVTPAPDGVMIAGAKDGCCYIINPADASVQSFFTGAAVTSVLAVGSAAIAVGGDDGKISVWSRLDFSRMRLGNGHTRAVRQLAIGGAGSSQFLLSGADDGTTRRWAMRDGDAVMRCIETRAVHKAPVTSVAVHQGGAFCASAGWDGRVSVWNVNNRAVQPVLHRICDSSIRAIAFAPTMVVTLAAAAYDGSVHLYDVAAGHVSADFPLAHCGRPAAAAAFSHDGKRLLTADGAGAARLARSSVTGEVLGQLTGHALGVTGVAFSPTDAAAFTTAALDGTMRMWRVTDQQAQERRCAVHGGAVTAIALCPRSAYGPALFLSASRDRTVRATVAQTGDCAFTIQATQLPSAVAAIGCVPVAGSDRCIIVTATSDGGVQGWRSAPGLGGADGSRLWEADAAACQGVATSIAPSPDAPGRVVVVSRNRVTVLCAHKGTTIESFGLPTRCDRTIIPAARPSDDEDSIEAVSALSGHAVYARDGGSWHELLMAVPDEDSDFATAAASAGAGFVVAYRQGGVAVIDSDGVRSDSTLHGVSPAVPEGAWVTAAAVVDENRVVLGLSSGALLVAEVRADGLRPVALFIASARISAVAACAGGDDVDGATVQAGDALGNVYLLRVPLAPFVAESGATTPTSECVSEASAADEFAFIIGAPNAPAQVAASGFDPAEWADGTRFAVLWAKLDRRAPAEERKRFFADQKAALKAAMALHRVLPAAREAMRAYATQTIQMYQIHSNLAAMAPAVI